MMSHQSTNHPRGFTLIELMVVVSMIALLLGFSVPLVFKIDELSRDRSGVNTFGVAVTAARAYATRKIADLDNIPQAEYGGAAVLVTPMNQLRIIADLQDEIMEKEGYSAYGYDTQTSRMEAIALPRGIGAVGITRNGTGGGGVSLIAPPFAIRFNRHGQLITENRLDPVPPDSDKPTSMTPEQWVTYKNNYKNDVRRNLIYYDHNFDGAYTKTVSRPAGYDPTPFDPDITADITSKWNAAAGQWMLPFETIESVVGVIVFAKADFEDAGGKFPSTAPVQGCTNGCGSGVAGINKWMFENGSVLFFSRNTGNVLRRKNP